MKQVLGRQVKSWDARSSLGTPGQVLVRQVKSWDARSSLGDGLEYRNAKLTVYAGCGPEKNKINLKLGQISKVLVGNKLV